MSTEPTTTSKGFDPRALIAGGFVALYLLGIVLIGFNAGGLAYTKRQLGIVFWNMLIGAASAVAIYFDARRFQAAHSHVLLIAIVPVVFVPIYCFKRASLIQQAKAQPAPASVPLPIWVGMAVLLLIPLLGLLFTSSPQQQAVTTARELTRLFSEMGSILDSVKDEDTARKAIPQLEERSNKVNELMKKTDKPAIARLLLTEDKGVMENYTKAKVDMGSSWDRANTNLSAEQARKLSDLHRNLRVLVP